jgi:hypothetical protein
LRQNNIRLYDFRFGGTLASFFLEFDSMSDTMSDFDPVAFDRLVDAMDADVRPSAPAEFPRLMDNVRLLSPQPAFVPMEVNATEVAFDSSVVLDRLMADVPPPAPLTAPRIRLCRASTIAKVAASPMSEEDIQAIFLPNTDQNGATKLDMLARLRREHPDIPVFLAYRGGLRPARDFCVKLMTQLKKAI